MFVGPNAMTEVVALVLTMFAAVKRILASVRCDP